jgi:hypothetical protein
VHLFGRKDRAGLIFNRLGRPYRRLLSVCLLDFLNL